MNFQLLSFFSVVAIAGQAWCQAPWMENTPIVEVKRELYQSAPRPGAAAYLSVADLGAGLQLEQILTEEVRSDEFEKPRRRRSGDNGRTWSALEPVTDHWAFPKDDFIWWAPSPSFYFYDPQTKVTLAMWLRQNLVGGRYYNHTFARLSKDLGLTWGEPTLLRYEGGDDFDPADPLKKSYLESNIAYFGQKIIRHSNGTLIFAVSGVRIPRDAPDPNPQRIAVWDTPADSRNLGSLLFVGRWNAAAGDYDWTAGKPVWVPRHVSSRGLMEPDVAELNDGRVLVVWRCSNAGIDPAREPGRKRFSVSSDGGLTLSPVAEWKYDDGSGVYSPSSFHLLLRHSANGKLYWFGNLSEQPTSGNEPRYPLVIAEVEETIPALRKATVTVIDDRQPDDPRPVSLSNFAVIENRESHDFELYMTRVGDKTGDSVYRYTVKLK
ncbi:MAG: exo-alpha-sialidase [Rhodopirellula sp.]|nr:exo-alpha-sialidase [Rhodopirellula sp.]